MAHALIGGYRLPSPLDLEPASPLASRPLPSAQVRRIRRPPSASSRDSPPRSVRRPSACVQAIPRRAAARHVLPSSAPYGGRPAISVGARWDAVPALGIVLQRCRCLALSCRSAARWEVALGWSSPERARLGGRGWGVARGTACRTRVVPQRHCKRSLTRRNSAIGRWGDALD